MKTTIILFVIGLLSLIGASVQAQMLLHVDNPPVITVQPVMAQTLVVGDTLRLIITAANAKDYQWYKNGLPLTGATSAVYTVPNVSIGYGGVYHCVAYNGACQVCSNHVMVTVKSQK